MRTPCETHTRDGRLVPKIRYFTRADAKRAAKLTEQRFRERDLHPYQCPECGLWHVGHERKVMS